jgi:predicted nucleotide-binding protein (sugar kinase/HSP70/actin superfamily)
MYIGIPRSLGYYLYYPFWHGFFGDLGIEVKLSGKTTKRLVSRGSALVVPETCLPVKIYIGHVLDLLDKGVDVIYSPSIQSVAFKIYNCSKLRGLPDLVRNVVNKDFTLIEPTLDKSEKKQGLYDYLYESVKPFGITNKKRIKQATKAGWVTYNKYMELMQLGLDYHTAMDVAIGKKADYQLDDEEKPISVAVCSHSYNVYDDYFSMKLVKKLQNFGAKVYVPDSVPREDLLRGIDKLDAVLYWANETEVSGVAGHFIDNDKIDGLITMTAFGCGPDSLMIERITRKAKKHKKPVLNLTIDEHTGEAGFITRLEAFTDMLLRTKRKSIISNLERQVNTQEKVCSSQTRPHIEKVSIG